jgi:hypothetical protein
MICATSFFHVIKIDDFTELILTVSEINDN